MRDRQAPGQPIQLDDVHDAPAPLAGERAGLLAAGIAAVSPVLISADSAVMSETLLGLLVLLCALAAYRLRERPTYGPATLLGVLVLPPSVTVREPLFAVTLPAGVQFAP